MNLSGRSNATKMVAVEDAQALVRTKLSLWFHNPSRESRADLENAMVATDDLLDAIICGHALNDGGLYAKAGRHG